MLTENLKIALETLSNNKLRASLTLLGIVIGVFSIISIMTLLSALQLGIEQGLSSLGSNTYQVQKYPAIQVGGPVSMRKYRNRPDITYDQGLRLKERASIYNFISLEDYVNEKVFRYKGIHTNPNNTIGGVTPEYLPTNNRQIQYGRFITETDVQNNRRVAVLGMDVIEKLFRFADPIGQKIILDNNEFEVIGVFERKGEGFGQSNDNFALIPITTMQTLYGKNIRSLNIAIQAQDKESFEASKENIISVLRVIRKVKPGEENNFEIFSNESLIVEVNKFTQYFKYGAGFISFISLIAAGVGIMNIMLVSVTERTREIGVRKAIGAKSKSILIQFLVEAIILCQIGGIIGILLGILSGNVLGLYLNSPVVIPYDWVIIGFVVCFSVGIIFGVYPAYKAAKLNPIDALRFE